MVFSRCSKVSPPERPTATAGSMDRPAATLLHLGPGLGNGLANLHNACKGKVPVVNIVGDHATYHKQYDAKLESDIETVRATSPPDSDVIVDRARGADAAEAVAVALGPPGQVVTLIPPADISWKTAACSAEPAPVQSRTAVDATRDLVAKVVRSGDPVAMFLGGSVLQNEA